MYRSISLLMLALSFTVGLLAQQNDFSASWKQIENVIEQDLPETAIYELQKLRNDAVIKGDLAQEVKAYLFELRLKAEKDPSLTGQLLTEAEQFTTQLKTSPEKGLMYLMLAETYSIYLNHKRYGLDNRSTILTPSTSIPDPKKLALWSKSDVMNTIDRMVALAFKDTFQLQQRRIGTNDTFIASDTLQFQRATTLYDLMLLKTIELYATADYEKNTEYWYRRHLNYRRSQLEIFPLVMAEISLYENIFSWKQTDPNIERKRFQTLDSLILLYDDHPEVVELIAEKAKLQLQEVNKREHKRLAYELCTGGIKRYPDYPRIQQLFNIQKQIEVKNLFLQADSHFRFGDSIRFTLTTTNTSTIKIGLYRINGPVIRYQQHLSERMYKNDIQPFTDVTLVDSQIVEMEADPDFAAQTRKLNFTKKSYGIYELRAIVADVTEAENTTQVAFVVTDLLGIHRPLNADSVLVYTIDSYSGKPQNGVQATLFDRRWDGTGKYQLIEIGKAASTKEGRMVIVGTGVSRNANSLWLSRGNDQYCWLEHYNQGYYTNEYKTNQVRKNIQFFTDRSIYRPGQVLHYKAIAYRSDSRMEKVLTDTLLTISLFDTNENMVSTQQLKTNTFGSVAGSFVLPASGLNGSYSLRCGDFQQNFKVEEYKRPTFEVELKTDSKELHFGKPIQFRGKVTAFAGYPVSNATVHYRIRKKSMHLFRPYPAYRVNSHVVGKGTTTSNADGSFTFTFVPEKLELAFAARFQYYKYEITADVTAPDGETQQGITSMMIGEKSLMLFSTVPDIIEKSKKLNPSVRIENLNGATVDKTVFYELNYIPDDGKLNEGAEWPGSINQPILSKQVQKGKFLCSDSLKLDVSKLNSGKYRLLLYALDEGGDTIKAENRFILYSTTDKKPAVSSYTWLNETTITASPGKLVKIPFGTSLRRAWVLYEVNYGNKLIEQKWMRQCNSIREYRVLFDEKYRNGLTVRFTIVHAGKIHVKEVIIKAPAKKKGLKPQLTVFRDKLRPGSEEYWTVAIPKTNQPTAELLAGMYDATLDQFEPLQWQFATFYTPPVPRTSNWVLQNWYWSHGIWHYQYPFAEEAAYSIANIDFYNVPAALVTDRNSGPIFIRGMKASSTRVPGNSDQVVENDVVFAMVESPGMPEEVSRPNVKLRENFNETAFFYPQLQADTAGLFHFSFTLPESLTRWKLKLLAHSSDLFTGQSEYTFESQKELMVNMNLPRFVRQSDSWELQVSVVNLTNQAIDTRVKLQIFNPLENNPVNGFSPEIKSIRLDDKGQQTVSWNIPALSGYDLVACRIEAQTAEFSDGEQRYLPILSDRMLITESLPFVVKDESINTIELPALPEGTEVKQVSLEFTSNPAWTALQALPVLSVPESNSAIDLLGAWYSNAVSLQILKSNPVLKTVIQQLSARGLTEEAWISELEKNQDLKMLLIKETPWVQAAAEQTQQQRELIRLLNEQQLQSDARKYLKELSNLQNASGSFSWMAGMPESRYITQLVVEKLQRMETDSFIIHDIDVRLKRALAYLDACMTGDYKLIKKTDKKYKERKTIDILQLYYLTVRSAFPELEISESDLEANMYYANQISTYRHSFSIYEKALAAQYFHRTGQTTYAKQMLSSLREMAVNDPLKGMYWPRLKSGWLWNERPLSIHTRILEAFLEIQGKLYKPAEINNPVISPDKFTQNNRATTYSNETEAMKLWLLNQKQTTHWDNRLTTLEALMAVLTTGESLLSKSSDYQFKYRTTDLREPLLKLKTEPVLPGSGYFRQALQFNTSAISAEAIPASGNTIRQPSYPENIINNVQTGSNFARGAVYRQYFQDRDKSQQSGSELTVERRYFLQKIVDGIATLTEINAGTILQTGDEIISRMVLNVENDYEFVVLNDTKAASLEVKSPLSGIIFKDGLLFYRTPGDISTTYFFHHLPRGSYVLEESYYLSQKGDFSAGSAEIQCLYAPEYSGKSSGTRINSSKYKK